MSTSPPPGVSPTLDPTVLEAPEIADALIIGASANGERVFHPGYTAAQTGFTAMHSANVALVEAEKAIKATNDPAANRRLRAGAEKRLVDARKAADTALESLGQHRAKVQSEIDEALGLPAAREVVTTAMRCESIRAHVRSLATPVARMEAIRAAISAGDVEAASAALSCSPLALGLTNKEAEILRSFAESTFTPRHVAIRDGLDRVRGLVAQADAITGRRFGSLIGKGDSGEARAEAALRNLEGGAA